MGKPKLKPQFSLTSANLTRGAAKGSLVARQVLCDKAEDLAKSTERTRQLERDVKERRVLVEEAKARLDERQAAYERRVKDLDATRKHADSIEREAGRYRRLLAGDRTDDVLVQQQLDTAREEHVNAQKLLEKAKTDLKDAHAQREHLEVEIESMRNGAAKIVIQTATARNQLLALQSRPTSSQNDALNEVKLLLSHLEHVIVEKDKVLMTAREKENRLSDKSVVIHDASSNSVKATEKKVREIASHTKTIGERTREVNQLNEQKSKATTTLKRELAAIDVDVLRAEVTKLRQELESLRQVVAPSSAYDLADRNAIDRSLLETRAQAISAVESELAVQRRAVLVAESRCVTIRDPLTTDDGPPPARKRRLEVMDRLRDLARDPFKPLYAALDPQASFIVLMPTDSDERANTDAESIVCSQNVILALVDSYTKRLPAKRAINGTAKSVELQRERERGVALEDEIAQLEDLRHDLAQKLNQGPRQPTKHAAIDPVTRIKTTEDTVASLQAAAELLRLQLNTVRDENIRLLLGSVTE